MSDGITRRDSLTAIAAFCAAPIAMLRAESGGRINDDHEAWVLERFRDADQEHKDLIERILLSLQKDAPLPPGWWAEGEGRERMPMNERDAVEMRALVKSDREWRAKQAAERQSREAVQ